MCQTRWSVWISALEMRSLPVYMNLTAFFMCRVSTPGRFTSTISTSALPTVFSRLFRYLLWAAIKNLCARITPPLSHLNTMSKLCFRLLISFIMGLRVFSGTTTGPSLTRGGPILFYLET